MKLKRIGIYGECDVHYNIKGDRLEYHVEGIVDTFDFSEHITGRLDRVETHLKYNPIISASRIDEELYLELLHFVRYGDPLIHDEDFLEVSDGYDTLEE